MDEATRISLKDQFNSLLVHAIEGRRGGMALMRVLEELDFYNSPASAKHHLNVPGGLVLHSLNVARAALELCDKIQDNRSPVRALQWLQRGVQALREKQCCRYKA